MIIEEQPQPINTYELHTPKLYVAVYYYKNSQTPFGLTTDSKEKLLQSLNAYQGIDESKPIKIFTLNC
jgi:hypothetical protein